MSAEGQYYRYIVNRRQNSERGFLHMYTGNYECLELFVKPEAGKKGSEMCIRDRYITELVEPQISTIVQPIDRMAEESVKNLCELINGKKVKNKKSILIPEFRKGGTTV